MASVGVLSSQAVSGVFRASEAVAAFASDITRRIAVHNSAEAVPGAPDEPSAAEQRDKSERLQRLESSLADTIAYMTEEHGEKAGTVAMALVYKRVGEGGVTEESLGNAFLDTTRFLDSNFGTAAGDRFMDHLNGNLNDSLNAYFDNGLNETFFAVSAPSGISGANFIPENTDDAAQQAAQSILALLEEARKNLEKNIKRPANPYVTMLQRGDAQVGLLMDTAA